MKRQQMVDEAVRRATRRSPFKPEDMLTGDWFDNCFIPFSYDVQDEFERLSTDEEKAALQTRDA